MYKEDLTLNNLQGLICHKTKPNTHIANDDCQFFAYVIISPLALHLCYSNIYTLSVFIYKYSKLYYHYHTHTLTHSLTHTLSLAEVSGS